MTSTVMQEWVDSVRKIFSITSTSKTSSVDSDSEEAEEVEEDQVVSRAYSTFSGLEEVAATDPNRAMTCFMK